MPETPHDHSATRVEARRSQRVLLRIPIQVKGFPEEGIPINEDTTTVEVNAHGALIVLAMRVRPGQKLVLRNWGNAKEQECRVVHVKEIHGAKNEVGIAFSIPQAKFWNIQFPPEDWKPFET
jgi:hypothetical protein